MHMAIPLGVALLITVLVALLVLFAQQRRETSEQSAPFSKVYEITGPGLFEFEIVGESYYQDALDMICGGKRPGGHRREARALLVPENDNPHDDQAVSVIIESQRVGYLSRRHARELRAQSDGDVAWTVAAVIVGGWYEADGSEGHYGVKLDLPLV